MIEAAANLLFPPRCVFCNVRIASGHRCHDCTCLLPVLNACCEHCAKPLAAPAADLLQCGDCQVSPPPFTRTRAAFEYAFPVDAALKSMKFNARLYYVPAFAADLLPLLERHFADSDALVPVPLHRRRYARRGFNQAVELCRPLAKSSGLPMLLNTHRIRATATQSGLDALQRRRNLAGAFRVHGRLRGVRPLIIDDVMTTGETCRQLASTLLSAGARCVGVLVVARA